MKLRPRFPLLGKMLLWLGLHLAVLAAAFVLFVGWQLRLGLDSLLSGTAGERLEALGEELSHAMVAAPRRDWPALLEAKARPYGLEPFLLLERGNWALGSASAVPPDVLERLNDERRPRAGRPGNGPGGGPPPRRGEGPRRGPRPSGPAADRGGPEAQALFLVRARGGKGYWAGIDLPLFVPRQQQPLHGVVLLRSDQLAGGGLFFDLMPWIGGGLAVLALSLAVWAPFFLGISRYASRLSKATSRIAEGRFDVRVGGSRSDELGMVGHSIESMARRLDRLVGGQRRFLGDVAHELCSPLARIRTGLGVLEHGMGEGSADRLASIEEDVEELSELVSEVLAFTRASTAPDSVKPEVVELRELVEQAASRECPGHELTIDLPESSGVTADRRLLARAVANLLRNADRHGGATSRIRVSGRRDGDAFELVVEDDGPGVDEAKLERLFEPFYRPDEARTRESGGAGLGLAIVRSAVEACGGSVAASRSPLGGLAVTLTLEPV